MNNKEPNKKPELSSLDGERGLPSVNDTEVFNKIYGYFFTVILLLFGIVIGVRFLKSQKKVNMHKTTQQEKQIEKPDSDIPIRKTFYAQIPPPLPEQPTHSNILTENLHNSMLAEKQSKKQGTSITDSQKQQLIALARARSTLTVHNDNKEKNLSNVSKEIKENLPNPVGVVNSAMHEKKHPKKLTSNLETTQTPSNIARNLGNRNFLLTKGTFIDCALQTKLDSTVPGMTACIVTRNIYSDNGRVVLIERGSTVSGEYQSNLQQGMKRIFVLWTRVKTPNGIIVDLDSPGADALGASGLPGHIDTHFWKRFGGAMMLSLVDDAAKMAASSKNKGQTFNFNSTGEAAKEASTEALKNTINIPPTLYKNQGDQIGIHVARDLDFSKVYDLACE
ncbi:MAG: type IV secretion system protein VirB10 (plasmid) [Candidatus Symbiodolus clandestinus]